ncbi:MAG: D-alanyl-D-alanine carboxypeptidase/D-alanyl-D-alanine-endopeptidase, partial [Candidatus Eremiobacteraeota bacterium]|nr:D-alanyl-D-alanine carboxypeptidase/D-alanyl-D-alanine-endopeptidase [Candidatus Eremiobacteraeota bacterium]
DATFLSGPERNPRWEASDAQYGFSAATSAISLDQDTIEVHVSPATGGLPARVWLEPPSSIATVSGDVVTVAPGLQTTIAVNPGDEPNHFSIGGQIAADDRKAILYVPIHGIPLYVADVLTRMLQQREILVAKPPGVGVTPRGMQVLWRHRSMPLDKVVAKMLFESNNHLAEQLLRTIGRVVNGVGTDRAGVVAERNFLRRRGIPRAGLNLVDGSGLSASNRSSAMTLAALLDDDRRSRGGRIYDALPRVGVEGTVKYYRLGAARGRVRAKSGHLAGVESLAGYIATLHSGSFAFAFLFENGEDPDAVDARITRAVERLAEF